MKSLILGLFSVVFGLQGASAEYSAQVFAQNSKKQKLLYNMTASKQPGQVDGTEVLTLEYKDLSGTVVHKETFILKGDQVIQADINQSQTKQTAHVEIKDGKVFFTKTKDSSTKNSDEKLSDTFVMSGNFQKFVQSKWKDLSEGKTIDFRYGVWDRLETVGFSLFKVSEEKVDNIDCLVLKMKPSSFIIAALVKPIYMKFSKDSMRMIELNGRVAPKLKDGDSWKDLDAEVVYKYE